MDNSILDLHKWRFLMETIKRKDGITRFRESYYLGSKKINSPPFTRKTDAKAWKTRMLNAKMSNLALGEQYFKNQNVTFKEFAERWMNSHIKVNCAPKTYLSYESILRNYLYPRYAAFKLSDFNEDHGNQLILELRKIKGPKGIEHVWIVLRAIMIKAKKERLIYHYPFDNIRLPKANLKDDNFWEKLEINQFLQANTKDQLYPFYYVAIQTGCRLAELCGLKWDRIDFSRNLISITRTRDKFGLKETTKTKIKRIIPMTAEVKATLLGIFEKRIGNPFVFLEADGGEVKYSHIYRRFKKAQTKAGISHQIRFHDLRHSFASNYMMNGGNLFDLQKLLGHTDFKMTMRYAHLTPDHLQSSVKFMSIASDKTIPVLDLQALEASENVRAII